MDFAYWYVIYLSYPYPLIAITGKAAHLPPGGRNSSSRKTRQRSDMAMPVHEGGHENMTFCCHVLPIWHMDGAI